MSENFKDDTRHEIAKLAQDKPSTSLLECMVDRATSSVFENKETRDEVNHYTAGAMKTFGLFAHGRLGMGATIVTHALDAAKVEDSTSTRFVDAAIGSLKGYALKKTFGALGGAEALGVAPKAITLGLASRFVDTALTRQNYFDPATGFSLQRGWDNAVDKTFDKTALQVDLIAGLGAHAMGFAANKLTGDAIARSPLMSTMVNGGAFGMVTGAHTEVLRQKGLGIKAHELDWSQIAFRSALQGGVDSFASMGGGIQADARVRKAISERASALKENVKAELNHGVGTVQAWFDNLGGPGLTPAYAGIGSRSGVRAGSFMFSEGARQPAFAPILAVHMTADAGKSLAPPTTGTASGERATGVPRVTAGTERTTVTAGAERTTVTANGVPTSEVTATGQPTRANAVEAVVPKAAPIETVAPVTIPEQAGGDTKPAGKGRHKQATEKVEHPAEPGFAERPTTIKGLANLAVLNDSIVRGGRITTPEALQALKDRGVTLVVDLRCEATKDHKEIVRDAGNKPLLIDGQVKYQEYQWCVDKGVTYAFRELSTASATMRDVRGFLELAQAEVDRGGKVYIHCQRGIDRTGVMGAAWRIAKEGWSPERALREMEHFGYRGHRGTEKLIDLVHEIGRAYPERRPGEPVAPTVALETTATARLNALAVAVEATAGVPGSGKVVAEPVTGKVGGEPGASKVGAEPVLSVKPLADGLQPAADKPGQPLEETATAPKKPAIRRKVNSEFAVESDSGPGPSMQTGWRPLEPAAPMTIAAVAEVATRVAPEAGAIEVQRAFELYREFNTNFGAERGTFLALALAKSERDAMSGWERASRAKESQLSSTDLLDSRLLAMEIREEMAQRTTAGKILAHLITSEPVAATVAVGLTSTSHLAGVGTEQFRTLTKAAMERKQDVHQEDVRKLVIALDERVKVDLHECPIGERAERINEYIDLAMSLEGRAKATADTRAEALITTLACLTPAEVRGLSSQRFEHIANAVNKTNLGYYCSTERANIIHELLIDPRTPQKAQDVCIRTLAELPDTLTHLTPQQMASVRRKADSYFQRLSQESSGTVQAGVWGRPMDHVREIVDRTVASPMTTVDMANYLRTNFWPVDVPKAVAMLKERAPYLSIHELARNLQEVGSDITQNRPEYFVEGQKDSRNYPVRQVRALCLTETGAALSYEFRKNTGIEVDVHEVRTQADGTIVMRSAEGIYILKEGKAFVVETEKIPVNVDPDGKNIMGRIPVLDAHGKMRVASKPIELGPFVLFDPMAGTPSAIRTALQPMKKFMPTYIGEFHKGTNFMDIMEMSTGRVQPAQRIQAEMAKRQGWDSYQVAGSKDPIMADAEARQAAAELSEVISGVSSQKRTDLETRTMLYIIDTAIKSTSLEQTAFALNATQTFLGPKEMAAQARDLHWKLTSAVGGFPHPPGQRAPQGTSTSIPENIRFVTNADNGGSSHLMLDIYRRVNGLGDKCFDRFFVPVDQLGAPENARKTAIYLDDYGYTCKQSINQALKMRGLARVEKARSLFDDIASREGKVVLWIPEGLEGDGLRRLAEGAAGFGHPALPKVRIVQAPDMQSVSLKGSERLMDLRREVDRDGLKTVVGTLGAYQIGIDRAIGANVRLLTPDTYADTRRILEARVNARLSDPAQRAVALTALTSLIKRAEFNRTGNEVNLVSGLVPFHMVPNDNSNFVNDLHSKYLMTRPRANSSQRINIQHGRPIAEVTGNPAEVSGQLSQMRRLNPHDPFLQEGTRADFQVKAERHADTVLSNEGMPSTIRKRAIALTQFARQFIPLDDPIRERLIVVPDAQMNGSQEQVALHTRRTAIGGQQFGADVRNADGFVVFQSKKAHSTYSYAQASIEIRVPLDTVAALSDPKLRASALTGLQSSIYHQLHTLNQMKLRTDVVQAARTDLGEPRFKREHGEVTQPLALKDKQVAITSAEEMQRRLLEAYTPSAPADPNTVTILKSAISDSLIDIKSIVNDGLEPYHLTPMEQTEHGHKVSFANPIKIKIDEANAIDVTGVESRGNNVYLLTKDGRSHQRPVKLIEESIRCVVNDEVVFQGSGVPGAQLMGKLNNPMNRLAIIAESLQVFDQRVKSKMQLPLETGSIGLMLDRSLRHLRDHSTPTAPMTAVETTG